STSSFASWRGYMTATGCSYRAPCSGCKRVRPQGQRATSSLMPLEHPPETIRAIGSFKSTRVPLHLSVNLFEDYLSAIEFGAVSDLKPADEIIEIGEDFRFLTRSPGGPINGFEVKELADFDLDVEGEVLCAGPRFAVPALGLKQATPAEIIIAARATFTKL